jgi:hypothetical protein
MTRIARTAVTLVMLGAGAAACGGSGGGGGPGGVDRAKQVSAVTAADRELLCDWFAAQVGGYGAAPTCAQSFITAPPSKTECTTDFPVCAVTVGSLQDCMETILDAQAVCTEASLTAAMADANCQTVGAAGCFD